MIDKYTLFRALMDLMSEVADVTDADMNTWDGGMVVSGEDADSKITIEVAIRKKIQEGNEDA